MDLEFQKYSTLSKYAFQNRYQDFEETRNFPKEDLGAYPFDKMEEECGVFGLHSTQELDTFSLSQFGLFALQHRGQEACGIAVGNKGKIFSVKDEGLVLDVFKTIEEPEQFMGSTVIGHTRYTTAGDKKKYNFQPFFAKNEYDQIILSIAHNGNLTNAKQLRKELEDEGVVFRATSDTEVILRLIQKNLDLGLRGAIKATMEKIEGAYSVVGITRNKFFAFRDFNGIRPLVLGAIDENTFVYIDPPYRPLTATASFTSYAEADFNDKEQRELGAFVDGITAKKAKVVISNSDPKNSDEDDTFFDDLYGRYNILRVTAKRMINCNGESRGNVSELLISNY